MTRDLEAVSLDGRVFAGVSNSAGGQVNSATRFIYREADGRVRARYGGGLIERGWLVGVRDGDMLRFRYVHLDTEGRTASGRCTTRIEALDDGRLRLHETWSWESRPGAGVSVVEEVAGRRPVTSAVLLTAASTVNALVTEAGDDATWESRAGDLVWTCRRTLDHRPDTLLLYASHLARRATAALPFVRDFDPARSPTELGQAVISAAAILAEVADAAPPGTRAFHPAGMADAEGFLAMGADELLVHAHDVASGLGVALAPPGEPAARVRDRLFPWAPTDTPAWDTLLWANGRIELPGPAAP